MAINLTIFFTIGMTSNSTSNGHKTKAMFLDVVGTSNSCGRWYMILDAKSSRINYRQGHLCLSSNKHTSYIIISHIMQDKMIMSCNCIDSMKNQNLLMLKVIVFYIFLCKLSKAIVVWKLLLIVHNQCTTNCMLQYGLPLSPRTTHNTNMKICKHDLLYPLWCLSFRLLFLGSIFVVQCPNINFCVSIYCIFSDLLMTIFSSSNSILIKTY